MSRCRTRTGWPRPGGRGQPAGVERHRDERPEDQGRLVHELNQQIYKDFADAGIEIPFPQRDLHVRTMPATGD